MGSGTDALERHERRTETGWRARPEYGIFSVPDLDWHLADRARPAPPIYGKGLPRSKVADFLVIAEQELRGRHEGFHGGAVPKRPVHQRLRGLRPAAHRTRAHQLFGLTAA